MATDDDGNSTKEKAPVEKKTPEKKYVKKRPVPPLTELLANGSEESQKKTWKQMVVPPLLLAVVFFLSFLLFMQVFPHLPNNGGFQLPQRNSNTPRYSPGRSTEGVQHEKRHVPPQEEPREEKIINLAEVGL